MTLKQLIIPRGGAYTAPSAEEIAIVSSTPLANSGGLQDLGNVEPGDNDVFPID